MAENQTDADLLKRAARGEESAFAVLYERHRAAIYRFAYRFLGSRTLAEDVTQECFLALVRRPEGYQPEKAALRTYLCAAARNLSFKHLRKLGVETLTDEPPEPSVPPATRSPLQAILDDEVRDRVREAVEALPPLQREAIILFEYEEMSLAEIATIADADVGTIKSRLHRARERLRRSLAPWMSERTAASAAEMRA
jgi:RNA polymerase sigma-70 factor (ECF subfamily)